MRSLLLIAAVALAGCGVVIPCASLGECDCARTPECHRVTEVCYCPPSCGTAQIDCVCGGGKFLRCEHR